MPTEREVNILQEHLSIRYSDTAGKELKISTFFKDGGAIRIFEGTAEDQNKKWFFSGSYDGDRTVQIVENGGLDTRMIVEVTDIHQAVLRLTRLPRLFEGEIPKRFVVRRIGDEYRVHQL